MSAGCEPVAAFSWRGAGVTVGVYSSSWELPASPWAETFARHVKDRRYYEVVEETLPEGFTYRYALLRQTETGAASVVPFFLVDQDILTGTPGLLRRVIAPIRRLFPRFLKMRILMVGCVAGEGQLDDGEPWIIDALAGALAAYAREARASMILFKDFPSPFRAALAPLRGYGYHRAPSMPGATLELDFASFEEYVQERLSKVYRKGLRRKFRESERCGKLTMEVIHDASALAEELHALYLQTYERSPLQFERLTPDYFREVGRRMPGRARFFLWRLEGRLVAFSLCLLHDGVLHDLNVGMDYRVALDLHLYFVTWRDIIGWALEAGVRHYYTGPLNYDPKLHLRLRLAPLDLHARHLSPLINPFFGLALRYLQPARHDPVIARFPNASEL